MSDETRVGKIGVIGGTLVEFIAGINFYLYLRVSKQFASFHICLERTNRYLLANSFCDNLTSCPVRKDKVRAELIRIMDNAPMLTLNEVEGKESRPKSTVKIKGHKNGVPITNKVDLN